MKSILLAAPVLASMVLLGCGGGDDDLSGSLVELNVQPAEIGWTAATGATTCYVGPAGVVKITGGAPPYRLSASFPDRISVVAQVDDLGGTFAITFTNTPSGSCFDPGSVTVTDRLGRRTVVTLTNKLTA
ncbi:MAG: hypothetical protein AD742_12825 [Methylibium sp. NZG]|nr:MAG: hypothetical protein AD742_12825 [Methylibium sp. NZG]